MNKERPFEDITPVPNIKVGYLEKKAYLKIIDEQAKQIDSFAYTIMALQSRIDILEKNQRPHGEWIHPYTTDIACECSNCHRQMPITDYYNFCPNCGAYMRGKDDE